MLSILGELLALAIFMVIILSPCYCLIRGIIELFKAIKDKENRKRRVKHGILFILIFFGFALAWFIMYLNITSAILASM